MWTLVLKATDNLSFGLETKVLYALHDDWLLVGLGALYIHSRIRD